MSSKLIAVLIICVVPALPSPHSSRYRSRSSSPTYDQKQTGDYNIQLHLKDFQVVALLSEGALGDLGVRSKKKLSLCNNYHKYIVDISNNHIKFEDEIIFTFSKFLIGFKN